MEAMAGTCRKESCLDGGADTTVMCTVSGHY